MHTRPPARLARRAAAPPPKVALLAPEDNQSSAKALEPTASSTLFFKAQAAFKASRLCVPLIIPQTTLQLSRDPPGIRPLGSPPVTEYTLSALVSAPRALSVKHLSPLADLQPNGPISRAARREPP